MEQKQHLATRAWECHHRNRILVGRRNPLFEFNVTHIFTVPDDDFDDDYGDTRHRILR